MSCIDLLMKLMTCCFIWWIFWCCVNLTADSALLIFYNVVKCIKIKYLLCGSESSC